MRREERRSGTRKAKSGKEGEADRWCHDPSTARPDAPKRGAGKKSGRSGRDDKFRERAKAAQRGESGRAGPFGFAQGRRDGSSWSGDGNEGLTKDTESTEGRKKEKAYAEDTEFAEKRDSSLRRLRSE